MHKLNGNKVCMGKEQRGGTADGYEKERNAGNDPLYNSGGDSCQPDHLYSVYYERLLFPDKVERNFQGTGFHWLRKF